MAEKNKKSKSGEIILPIEDGDVKFEKIHCNGVDLTEQQMLELFAVSYAYLEAKERSKIILSGRTINQNI